MIEKTIILASGNKNKLKEIRQILPEYNVTSMQDFGFNKDIEETGTTFYENALIKAKTVSQALNLPALADDSGLCVDALNGQPGIFSARYAGDGNHEHNNDLLLNNLKGISNRKAKFVSCVVYYKPNGDIVFGYGETKGEILTERQGANGFGYDPLFFCYDLNKSFGQATAEEKNSVSHRFRALQDLKSKLK